MEPEENQPLFELHYYVPQNGKLAPVTERGTDVNSLIRAADNHKADRFEIYVVNDPYNPTEQATEEDLVVWFDVTNKGYWAKQLMSKPELKKKQLRRAPIQKQPAQPIINLKAPQQPFHPEMRGYGMNEHNTNNLPIMKKLSKHLMTEEHLPNYAIPEPHYEICIGFMKLRNHRLGGMAIFQVQDDDTFGKQIGADYLVELSHGVDQYELKPYGNNNYVINQNPMFHIRYIKVNPETRAYYILSGEEDGKFQYQGKYQELIIDPDRRWSPNGDTASFQYKVSKLKRDGATFLFGDEASKAGVFDKPTNPAQEMQEIKLSIGRLNETNLFMKNNPLTADDNIKEGETDNGMYQGGTTQSIAFGKNSPAEKAPVMETEPRFDQPIKELSTGLANKAADIASLRSQRNSADPIAAQRKGMQADNMSSYVNPAIKDAFVAVGGEAWKQGEAIVVSIPSNQGGDNVQIQIDKDGYQVTRGDIKQLAPNILPRLQRAIQKAQQDLKTPKKPTGGTPLAECSTGKKKYRMTEAQKAMLDELRLLQENIRKISGNKQLLY